MKGASASMLTTHGDMVVPRLLAKKGPSGTYSHFWISRAVGGTFVMIRYKPEMSDYFKTTHSKKLNTETRK